MARENPIEIDLIPNAAEEKKKLKEEAIKQCREWLEEYLPQSISIIDKESDNLVSIQTEDFLTLFELQMNKILKEEE